MVPTEANSVVFEYHNGNPASTLWYHDHALGLTRLNVVAGLLGAYIVRDPSDSVASLLPPREYEWVLMLQDKQFNPDGSLLFPSNGDNPDKHPYWLPEYFGDVIIVNGVAWPFLNVDRGQYLFRLIDASNARFYNLTIEVDGDNTTVVPFTIIGAGQGYLPSAVVQDWVVVAPGQRSELLVDFSSFEAGTTLTVKNSANTPFPGGDPVDPETTAIVMRFTVTSNAGFAPATLPSNLNPSYAPLPAATKRRRLTMYEVEYNESPLMSAINGQLWRGPTTEVGTLGETEEIELINLTEDAHPFHIHLSSHQVISRQDFDSESYSSNWTALNGGEPPYLFLPLELDPTPYLTGPLQSPDPVESGWVDTVILLPGQVTVIRIRYAQQNGQDFPFDATSAPGYVEHCHILDHEDNEMMLKLVMRRSGVVPVECQNNLYVGSCNSSLVNPCCSADRRCVRDASLCNGTFSERYYCIPAVIQ